MSDEATFASSGSSTGQGRGFREIARWLHENGIDCIKTALLSLFAWFARQCEQ
jgi:hypothetical protein